MKNPKGKNMRKAVYFNNTPIETLIDTGSDVNIIRKEVAEEANIQFCKNGSVKLKVAGQQYVSTIGYTYQTIRIDGESFDTIFYVVINRDLPVRALIGDELLKDVELISRCNVISIKHIQREFDNYLMNICVSDDTNSLPLVLRELINNYKPNKTVKTHIKLHICTTDDKPIYQQPRRLPCTQRTVDSYTLEMLAVVKALSKFRVYLLNKKFTVVTDCDAFKNTMKKKDTVPRVTRWVMYMQDYDFDIEHRKGTQMRHVDCLSRREILHIESVSPVHNKIKEQQKRDRFLNVVHEILKTQPFDDFVLKNGLIYKNLKGVELIAVPEAMEYEIIKNAHDKGHFKTNKMMEIIGSEFYIQSIKTKINDHVNNCVPCILNDNKTGRKEGLLQPIAKHGKPLDTWHIDHLGPMPSTNKNYQHIFAVVDALTKFVWLFPTKSTTANETLTKIKTVTNMFGNPRRIIPDRGPAFTSDAFKEFCTTEGIDLVHITTGIPRGNGQVEIINKIIISVLSKLSTENSEKWYTHVSDVQQFINCTFQRSIKTAPFELMIGVPMKLKSNINLCEILDDEMLKQFQEDRNKLREEARQQIEKVQAENKKTFNKHRKEAHQYKIGDIVAIKRTQFGTGMKLRPRFLGPYKVTSAIGQERFAVTKIEQQEGPKNTKTCSEYMKLWTA